MFTLLLTLLAAQAATIRASSTHNGADGKHTAAHAADGGFQKRLGRPRQ
jgi:hypothetical protein